MECLDKRDLKETVDQLVLLDLLDPQVKSLSVTVELKLKARREIRVTKVRGDLLDQEVWLDEEEKWVFQVSEDVLVSEVAEDHQALVNQVRRVSVVTEASLADQAQLLKLREKWVNQVLRVMLEFLDLPDPQDPLVKLLWQIHFQV